MAYDESLSAELSPGGWAVWGDRTLQAMFPRLARTLLVHRGFRFEKPEYLGLYYYLTAALAMWDRTFRHSYPNLKYWWRMEPDVLFSGSLGNLCAASHSTTEPVRCVLHSCPPLPLKVPCSLACSQREHGGGPEPGRLCAPGAFLEPEADADVRALGTQPRRS